MDKWPLVKLEDIAARTDFALSTGPFGSSIGSKTFRNVGVPVIRGSNLSTDIGVRLDDSDIIFIDECLADTFSRSKVRRGDLVFTCWGTINQVGMIDGRSKYDTYVISNKQMKITVDRKRADPLYIYYWFSSPHGQEVILSGGIGSSVPGFNLGQLRNIHLPLPSLAYQQAITSLLGALDDKIDLNRRMNETLEAMARAVYQDAVEDDWIDQALGEVCTIYDGPHATPKTTDNGPIFLGISNLSDGQLDLDDLRCVTEYDFMRWTKRVTPSETDVVFSYETRLGQAAWIPRNLRCCLGRRMGLLRAIPERVQPVILLHAYVSPNFQEVVRARTVHGSTVDRIPLVDMPDFPIRLPPVEKQHQIASALLPVRETICLNAEINRTLAELRDLLLPKLMSGEIRLRDAEKAVEAAL